MKQTPENKLQIKRSMCVLIYELSCVFD